ncbi:hypothetical protein ACFE04_009470 [Oxalis oulophora]
MSPKVLSVPSYFHEIFESRQIITQLCWWCIVLALNPDIEPNNETDQQLNYIKIQSAVIIAIKVCKIELLIRLSSNNTSAKPHHYIKGGDDGFKTWEKTIRRSLAVVDNNSTLILAAHRTHRPDPLDHFNDYNGGFISIGKKSLKAEDLVGKSRKVSTCDEYQAVKC